MFHRPFMHVTLLVSLVLLGVAADADEPIEFNRDIRPLLSDNCFACHGPDSHKREADLRLDTEEGLLTVIEPGEPGDSEFFRRIAEATGDEQMPPPEFGKQLTPAQIQLIGQWIESGAEWQGHWSFQPIQDPPIPVVEEPRSAGQEPFLLSDIDAFTLRAMQARKLAPSSVADRRTLIRRLSFDLTGLPPDPALVQSFIQDQRPDAYERIVDQLLDSPHYGERMAMWWLDLVRYADSVGYHGDQDVSVSPFRDYVIESFNNNKRFDVFTVEQLAGDLLPSPTREQMIASGYNRLGMMSAEGGVQPKEYLAKYIAERVRNLGGTWLGATLGCCECHDHKYDPFSMQDFYSFESFFADIQERGLYSGANSTGDWGPQIKVPTVEQAEQLAEFDRQLAELEAILATPTPELLAEQKQWEQALPTWQTLTAEQVTSEGGATLTVQEDGSILASGESPSSDVYRLEYSNVPQGVTGIRIEALPDPSLPAKGSGRAGNGNFVLTEVIARISGGGLAEPKTLKLQNATATYEQVGAAGNNPYKKWAIAAAIDHDEQGPGWGWAVMEQATQPQAAVIELAEDLQLAAGQRFTLELLQAHDNPQHTLGRFRLAATTAPRPLSATQVPGPIAELLAIPADSRSEQQQQQLAQHFRSIAPSLAETRQQITELRQRREQLDKSIVTTLVTSRVEPRMIRVLPRGNWMDDSGTPVQPSFPEFLEVTFASERERMNRLDLAHWVLADDNPLTARVFVNRIWKLYFGAGLSPKLDDLGAQGEWPSHPELLDFLASRFRESGWDVKELVKSVVMSGTYRQTSLVDEHTRSVDPFNRWLSRQSRFRLDAEMVRDNALAASGLLVRELGGESVKPYQPAGYWAYLNFPTRSWRADEGRDLYRRGLYVHWQRQYLHPSLLAFDAPSREECTADRPRSNTPLQSLVLLNDPIYVEAARVFAERILRSEAQSDEDRLRWAFQQTLNRNPSEAELGILLPLLEKHYSSYRDDEPAARQVVSIGDYPVGDDLNVAQWAAWTSVARTLLNLHETITRN